MISEKNYIWWINLPERKLSKARIKKAISAYKKKLKAHEKKKQ